MCADGAARELVDEQTRGEFLDFEFLEEFLDFEFLDEFLEEFLEE